MAVLGERSTNSNLELGNTRGLVCTICMCRVHTLGDAGRDRLSLALIDLHPIYTMLYGILCHVPDKSDNSTIDGKY